MTVALKPCRPLSAGCETGKPIIQRFLSEGNVDGLFVCLRFQSRPADFTDQLGFNRPVRDDFFMLYMLEDSYGISIKTYVSCFAVRVRA